MIVAAFIPDFVIGLERSALPKSQPSPLLVYEVKGRRQTVLAACPVARQGGVMTGMTRTRARALCPEALEVEARPRYYQRRADDLCANLLPFSDRIEHEVTAGLTIWLDLGKQPPADYSRVAQTLLTHCHQLTPGPVQIGLAVGRLTARIAAMTTASNTVRTVAPGHETALLATMPVQQFQTGKRFQEQCGQLGIRTLADLGGLPYNAVKTRLGDEGAQLHRLYQGVDRHTLQRFAIPLREEITHQFDIPIEEKTIIHNVLGRLAQRLHTRLIRSGLACSDISLTMTTDNEVVHTESRTLRTPIQGGKALREELERLVSLIEVDNGIGSVSVLLDQLTPPVPQQLDFFDQLFGDSRTFVDAAAQRLCARHQHTQLLRVTVLPEHSLVIERNSILTPVIAA